MKTVLRVIKHSQYKLSIQDNSFFNSYEGILGVFDKKKITYPCLKGNHLIAHMQLINLT